MTFFDVLIVGGGHGGAHAAIALLQAGFAGRIGIVSDEPDSPYERPPLSKEYLAGEKPFDRLLIRPEHFWAERGITLLLGRRVVDVYPKHQAVGCSDGTSLSNNALVWAAGEAAAAQL